MLLEDRLKKITTLLAEIGKQYNADLVRENLSDLKLNDKRKSKQLNYRLSTFPYRKFITCLDYKFYERKLNVDKENSRNTSITCPVCGYINKKNRVRDLFICKKCGFTFNIHYVACLNLFSRSNDGIVTIRSGRLFLISRKTAHVVTVNVAPNDAPIINDVLRVKPVHISKILKISKI